MYRTYGWTMSEARDLREGVGGGLGSGRRMALEEETEGAGERDWEKGGKERGEE